MERSAEWLRGAIEALDRARLDFTVTVPELQAEYVALLAAAEAREAFPIPDTLPAVPEASEAGERDYLGEARQAAIARAEAAEALVAGLRGALEEVDEVLCVTKAHDIGDAVVKAFSIINAAIALTPASAGERRNKQGV